MENIQHYLWNFLRRTIRGKIIFMKMKLTLPALLAILMLFSFDRHRNPPIHTPSPQPVAGQKIQAAILLDVSNSMDGLIDQAKAQLWNMVSTMGKVRCDGGAPQIEIALYEYGRPANGIRTGYIKQLSPFTKDLDKLSDILFSLQTDGGDEYCGQVIFSSLNELAWDPSPSNYKVIFIAGNEDFLQGNLRYTRACNLAKSKGVIVNTIYCGERLQGIREHWNISSECGGGSFTNINQNEKITEIPTPYDDEIITLNEKLNGTYLGYGSIASAKVAKVKYLDGKNMGLDKSVAVKRVTVKSNKAVYKNSEWDMVDKMDEDGDFINKMDRKDLADSLKGKSNEELKQLVETKSKERTAIQKKIAEKSAARDEFIKKEKAKKAGAPKPSNLESEIEKIIKKQIVQYKMTMP